MYEKLTNDEAYAKLLGLSERVRKQWNILARSGRPLKASGVYMKWVAWTERVGLTAAKFFPCPF
jgi:hypothetical protein